ncbi:MAG: O-antigen ligase family protein [Casimicrobiaceae bacterium]
MSANVPATPSRVAFFCSWLAWIGALAQIAIMFERGGNVDSAIALAGWIAPLTLLAAAGRIASMGLPTALRASGSRSALVALAILGGTAALSLLPLPVDRWLALPGRAAFSETVSALREPGLGLETLPVTMAPGATLRALLLVGSATSIFFTVLVLDRLQRTFFVTALLALGVFEVLLGVAQIALGGASIVTPDFVGHLRASGTFVNKNHFAALLAMLLPFAVFALLDRAMRVRRDESDRTPLRLAFWMTVSGLLAAGIVLSMSRAAYAATLVVLCLTAAVHIASTRRRSAHQRRLMIMGAAGALAAIALLLSSDFLVRAISDPAAVRSLSARAQMTAAGWQGALALFPLGSGLGSFSTVFPHFQPMQLQGFVEHAHNEYVQIVFELGLAGLIFLAAAAFAAWGLAQRAWRSLDALGLGHAALLGALALALHAWLDFPTRIPGVAFVFVAVVALACTELPQGARVRRGSTHGSGEKEVQSER